MHSHLEGSHTGTDSLAEQSRIVVTGMGTKNPISGIERTLSNFTDRLIGTWVKTTAFGVFEMVISIPRKFLGF